MNQTAAGLDLTGIRFVRGTERILPQFEGTPSEPRIQSYLDAGEKIADFARAAGAQVLVADPLLPLSEVPTYRLAPPHWRQPEFSRRLLARIIESHPHTIPQAESIRLFSYMGCVDKTYELHERLEEGNPFVLAFTNFARGHAKYLIERSEQLEKSLAAIEKMENQGHRVISCLEVRPFLQTPSDHYTSHRYVVAAGSNTLLAAGLLYSAHTKDEDRVVEDDRPYDTWNELTIFKQYLESRDSPYFLASRDIRSNVSSGGGVIPLLGTDHAPLTPTEERILKAHKVGQVTGSTKGMPAAATFIGKICGPAIDICLGIDSLENAQTGEEVLLECNAGPGSLTYNKCWLGGNAAAIEADMAQRRLALRSIALHHALTAGRSSTA